MRALRTFLKSTLRLMFTLLALPFWLLFWLTSLVFGKDQAITSYSQLMSLFPGQFGNYLRLAFYQLALEKCGKDSVIAFGTLFSQQDTQLGDGVYIGPQCNLGKCEIGDHCLLGSGVHIMSGKSQHNFDDLDTPLKDQGGQFQKVIVGEDSWLGNGTLVMANVGKKCIVGAGSVVVDDIPDYTIAAGNPAKALKNRSHDIKTDK